MSAKRMSVVFSVLVLAALSGPALAVDAAPYPGTRTIKTASSFKALWDKLEVAVKANGMFVVTRASASRGASGRGIKIPGNLVIGVYRNDFAVRMLKASVPSGIEAPLRFYVTENGDGTASLTYREPGATFAPYGSGDHDKMAVELGAIWAKIVKQATTG